MTLEQAKRLYKTWKMHPDLINTKQVVPVIEAFVRLSKDMKKLYDKEKEKWNYVQNVPMYSHVDMLTQT